tara:strand:- start:18 stop:479 length:462 start_codon:yes stop_codon:yes gene_type:complete
MRKSLTYTNSEYSFSVNYPVDWNVKEDLVELVVIFGGPSVLEGIYDVNINVNAERLHQEIALEDFVTASDLKARRTIPNYSTVQAYNTTIGGLPAIVLVATLSVKCNGKKVDLKNKYAIVIKDKVAYTITYDAPAECHDEYADCFDLVISSFK